MRPRVAVVEPDVELGKARCIRLGAAGFDAWATQPGLDTARQIMQRRPQVVLIDIDSDTYSGFDLHHCLLTSKRTRRLAVIYLTVRDHRTHRALAARYGAQGLFTHPVEHQSLAARIRELAGACV